MIKIVSSLVYALITGVIFFMVFFFIVPWLLLILGVMVIMFFVNAYFGRRNVKATITYINMTNMPPRMRYRENSLKDDMTVTVRPDGSVSEADPTWERELEAVTPKIIVEPADDSRQPKDVI